MFNRIPKINIFLFWTDKGLDLSHNFEIKKLSKYGNKILHGRMEEQVPEVQNMRKRKKELRKQTKIKMEISFSIHS